MEKELNRFCTIVNILKNRGSNQDDPVFMTEFVRRLPPQVMRPVYKKMLKGNWKFEDLVLIAYDVIREKKIIESAHENKKKCIQAEDLLAVKVNVAGAVQHLEQTSSKVSSQDWEKESFFRAMEAGTFDSDSD
uniref:SPK domain-containing protein n=1 Tax=Caenorhabditis tropicalis TaxID=1561998 RepID=A0A1I7T7W2_9PELO